MPRSAFRLLPLLLLLGACASNDASDEQSIDWLVVHQRFEEAVSRSSAAVQKDPNNAQLQAKHREATMAWLLEQGRRATFLDKDVQALEFFGQAADLEPGRAEPRMWIEKTRHKLAERWLETGLELHASDKLEAAMEAYDTALKFEPDKHSAQTGLAEATLAVNYRLGLGRAYYEEGLRSLSGSWLERAQRDFDAASKYLKEDPKVEERRKQVAVDLAEQRCTVAEQLEQDSKFDAARNEFRLAARLDPENTRAQAGKERCQIEAHAAQLYRDSKNEITRGRLEHAGELAEEGAKLTLVQRERFDGLKNEIQEARYETIYKDALTLERDGKYPEAVARFDELLKLAAYYKDTLTRKETLEDFITRADRLYTEAAGETDPTRRIEILRQILQFWPDYRDVQELVRTLSQPKSR